MHLQQFSYLLSFRCLVHTPLTQINCSESYLQQQQLLHCFPRASNLHMQRNLILHISCWPTNYYLSLLKILKPPSLRIGPPNHCPLYATTSKPLYFNKPNHQPSPASPPLLQVHTPIHPLQERRSNDPPHTNPRGPRRVHISIERKKNHNKPEPTHQNYAVILQFQ